MKKQEKQKQKIKEVLLKILHIVSYVLSLAFIGLCILTGVQSCSKPKAQANKIHRDYLTENLRSNSLYDSFAYTYSSKYTGTQTYVNAGVQEQLLKQCDNTLSIYNEYSSYHDYTYDYSLSGVYAYKTDINDFVPIISTHIHFRTYSRYGNDNDYYWRLLAIYFKADYGNAQSGFGYCEKNLDNQDGSAYNDTSYNFDTWWVGPVYNKFYCADNDIDNPVFNIFFNENKIGSDSSIVFNNQINYNAPLGRTLDSPIVPYASASGEFYFVNYDFLFLSGGQFFNRIRIAYQNANGVAYIENTGANPTPKIYSGTGAYTYAFMTYENTISNKSVSVNARDYVQYSPSTTSNGWYMANSSTWTSQVYKVVNILDISDNTLLDLTKLNNNIYGNGDIINNNVYLGGVFDLLRMAFGSLTGLMSISVLPGLSLGLFIFLPLVVTIIVLIFKAVRK